MPYTVQSADGGRFERERLDDALLTATRYAVTNSVQTRICSAGDGVVLWRSWIEGRKARTDGPRVRFPARIKFRAGAPCQ